VCVHLFRRSPSALEERYRREKERVNTISEQIIFAVWCARKGLNDYVENEMEWCGGGICLDEPECYSVLSNNSIALKVMKQKRWRIDATWTEACIDYAARCMFDARAIKYAFAKCRFFEECRGRTPVGYWTAVKTSAVLHSNEQLERLATSQLASLDPDSQ
jgi:hypothetical protein